MIRPKRGGSEMKHRIVTAAQMKAIEQAGNAHGLPYLQMMENAGLAAYAELKNVLPQPGSLLVVCGKGNNGGDGFVIARAAAKEGWKMGGGHPARYLESVARLRQVQRGLPELYVFSRPDAGPERGRDLQDQKRLFLVHQGRQTLSPAQQAAAKPDGLQIRHELQRQVHAF